MRNLIKRELMKYRDVFVCVSRIVSMRFLDQTHFSSRDVLRQKEV